MRHVLAEHQRPRAARHGASAGAGADAAARQQPAGGHPREYHGAHRLAGHRPRPQPVAAHPGVPLPHHDARVDPRVREPAGRRRPRDLEPRAAAGAAPQPQPDARVPSAGPWHSSAPHHAPGARVPHARPADRGHGAGRRARARLPDRDVPCHRRRRRPRRACAADARAALRRVRRSLQPPRPDGPPGPPPRPAPHLGLCSH